LQSDLIESGFNPPTLSHGLSGAERTRLPLNALTSNQKSNCNANSAVEIAGVLGAWVRTNTCPVFCAPWAHPVGTAAILPRSLLT
jgi:hypothetical protein